MRETIAIFAFSMSVTIMWALERLDNPSMPVILSMLIASFLLMAYSFAVLKKDGYGR